MNKNWYKKAMALDPNAYKTEPQPARLREHQDVGYAFNPFTGKTLALPQQQNQEQIDSLYSGVHFAFTQEQAALYACGKATAIDPPVIIEVEPKGLKQQPDVDALVDRSLSDYIDNKKMEWQSILQSGKDLDTMAEEFYGDIDGDHQNWTMEGDISDTADDIIMQQQLPIPPSVILSLIEKKTPQQVINIIKQLINGKISSKVLIKLVGQMRVNNNIDSSRVKAIYQIPWIDLSADVTNDPHSMDEERRDEYLEEQGWHMEGDDIINENGQIVPSYEELIYDQWLTLTPLYVNRQLYFKGYVSKDSVWHGTTLSRAKRAYPDLLGSVQYTPKTQSTPETGEDMGAVANSDKGWYKAPFMRSMNYIGLNKEEKKDISIKSANKYVVAQQKKAERRPYYVVTISQDEDRPIESLKNVRVWAVSSSQARQIFFKKYPFLKDYLGMMDVEARFDSVAWQNFLKKKEEQAKIDTRQKQEKEERIQQMWWNKD